MNELERAVELEKMIHEKVSEDIYVGVGVSRPVKGTKFIHMVHKNGKDVFSLHEMTDEEILEKAEELSKSIFIKIETICMDLIGKEVWVNKEKPVFVRGLYKNNEDEYIIETTTGNIYLVDDLYIKE